MMAAILNSAILDSAILHKTLTQTNSIWLKLIHSHSTWWCQPSWILPSWFPPFWTKKTSLIHYHSTWWWQPSSILPSWIQPFCTKLWLKLIQSDSNSFILTQLDNVSHLEFCHLGFHHFAQKKNFTHSFWLNLMMVAILNSAMLDSDTVILDSDTLLSSLRFTQNTLTPPWLWLKLIQSDSNSFILT